MSLVPLYDESGNVPCCYDLRFLEILIVKIKALNPMEQVDDFFLSLALIQFLVDFAGRPIFQLE